MRSGPKIIGVPQLFNFMQFSNCGSYFSWKMTKLSLTILAVNLVNTKKWYRKGTDL
jgi:hypothetical protein